MRTFWDARFASGTLSIRDAQTQSTSLFGGTRFYRAPAKTIAVSNYEPNMEIELLQKGAGDLQSALLYIIKQKSPLPPLRLEGEFILGVRARKRGPLGPYVCWKSKHNHSYR